MELTLSSTDRLHAEAVDLMHQINRRLMTRRVRHLRFAWRLGHSRSWRVLDPGAAGQLVPERD